MAQWHDEPRAIAQAIYLRTLYGKDSPYGRMSLGTPQGLGAMTPDDLQRFHGTYFVPNNAAIIVVGDVPLDQIRPRLDAVFGAWARGPVPNVREPATTGPVRREVTLVDKPAAAQSEIRIGAIGVARTTDDYFPLIVMNTILGGSFTSRLNQTLREEKQYTYGAGSSFAMGVWRGPFTAQSAVQTAVTDSALAVFMRELGSIREPVPADELDRAKNFVALRFPGRFQAVAQVADQLEDLYVYDLPTDYYNEYVQHVLAVTQDDVLRVAKRYVDPSRMAVIVVGDKAKIESSIRALNLGPMRVLSIEDVFGPPPVVGSE